MQWRSHALRRSVFEFCHSISARGLACMPSRVVGVNSGATATEGQSQLLLQNVNPHYLSSYYRRGVKPVLISTLLGFYRPWRSRALGGRHGPFGLGTATSTAKIESDSPFNMDGLWAQHSDALLKVLGKEPGKRSPGIQER